MATPAGGKMPEKLNDSGEKPAENTEDRFRVLTEMSGKFDANKARQQVEADRPKNTDDAERQTYQESAPLFSIGEKTEAERIDKSHVKDLEQIHDCEVKMVAENADVLGYNIDSKLIISPERRAQAIRAKEFLDSGGDITVLSEKFKQPAERIQEAIDEELSKDELLDDTLSKLPEGVKFRINPYSPSSAFTTANSERIVNEKGENRFRINSDVMAQMRKIKEKAAGSELSVVMSQLHEGEDGRPTSNIPEDPADYIALCQSFVEQSGYAEQAGKGLVLELGNECNMSHESGGPIFQSEAFAEKVDPEAYANLYFETAKALKASFPDVKLSLAGIAFYDHDFVKQVVDRIQAKKDADESLKDTKLIDVISFHPYRKTVEGPTPFMSNGKGLSESEVRVKSMEYWGSLSDDKKDAVKETILSGLTEAEKATVAGLPSEEIESKIAYKAFASFDHQLESLREIASQVGSEVTVGEISFYAGEWGESVDENEQERNAAYGRENGYTSFIWPGEQIVKHENPEKRKSL